MAKKEANFDLYIHDLLLINEGGDGNGIHAAGQQFCP